MGCATSQPVHDESTYARVAQKAAAADLTEPRSVRVFSGDSAEHTTGGSTGKVRELDQDICDAKWSPVKPLRHDIASDATWYPSKRSDTSDSAMDHPSTASRRSDLGSSSRLAEAAGSVRRSKEFRRSHELEREPLTAAVPARPALESIQSLSSQPSLPIPPNSDVSLRRPPRGSDVRSSESFSRGSTALPRNSDSLAHPRLSCQSEKSAPRSSGQSDGIGGRGRNSSNAVSEGDQFMEMDPSANHACNGSAIHRLNDNFRRNSMSNRNGSLDVDRRNSHQYMKEIDALLQSWDIKGDEITICKHSDGQDLVLGSGSYGQVYKGLRDGIQDVAVKVLFEGDADAMTSFIQEISLLKSLNYDKNIVQFYGARLQPGQIPMLVTEYMEGGDLRHAIDADLTGKLKWSAKGYDIALDICRAIHFLHSHNVIHSDIKSSNILLDRSRSTAKIADVGLARVMQKKQYRTSDEHAWTFAYASPEMLTGKPCSAASDIYSLGVVLWELAVRDKPSRGRLQRPKPDECSAAIADLISQCLKKEPAERPTAREVFEAIKQSHVSAVRASSWFA